MVIEMYKKKRVLQVNIDNNGGNGAFSLIRYLYKSLSDDYIFDYYTMGNFLKDDIYKEIIKNDGLCFSANLRKNKLIGHIMLPFNFYQFLRKNDYEIVHVHSEVAYKHFLFAVAAHYAGIKKVIIHSHSNDIDGSNKKIKYLFHRVLKVIVNKLGTDFLACSMPAAEWMFTADNLKSDKFHIINNGISLSEYRFNKDKRNAIRKNLGISQFLVLGHVGSLKKVKNQSFLLEIISKLDSSKYKLVLVGDGEDRALLEKKAKDLMCSNSVIFMGSRSDVNKILQGIDVFLFPSLFEGIPMSLIEAQTVGIPVIASDRINPAIKVNSNFDFLPIEKDYIETWANRIELLEDFHLKEKGYDNMSHSTFNIEKSADILRRIYS